MSLTACLASLAITALAADPAAAEAQANPAERQEPQASVQDVTVSGDVVIESRVSVDSTAVAIGGPAFAFAPPVEAQAEPAEQAETSPASAADYRVIIGGDVTITAPVRPLTSIGIGFGTPHATARLGALPRGRIEIIEGSVDISAIGPSRCNDPRLGLIGTPRNEDCKRVGSIGLAPDCRLESPTAVAVEIGARRPDAQPADPESRR